MNKRPHKQYVHKTHPDVIQGESWCDEHPHTNLAETVLPLEPRFMFDAAGLATGAEVTVDAAAQSQADAALDATQVEDATAPAVGQNDNEDLITALATNTPPGNTQEITFVDSSVSNYQTLLSGIDPNIEVVMLDASRDGVEQIAEVLSGRSDLSAIHIISHGDAGQLELGNTTLSLDSMQGEHADELGIIGQALSNDADILIYGCNFAEGGSGQQAAETLAELTGADVAASDDLSGHESLGGDWDLEVQQGEIETDVVISDIAQDNWIDTLDLPLTSGPVAGSYTAASGGQATITITGADGGDANTTGGQGATVTAVFNVSGGDVIDYVIGGVGSSAGSSTAGGGGSTGIYINGQLVMVGGGGGGGDNSASPGADGLGGNDADLGTDGDAGTGTANQGAAGTAGSGGGGTGAGAGANTGGGGGGGVLSAGVDGNILVGSGGAVSSAGVTITGLETADLVSGGTGDGTLGGDGGQGLTGGGGGGEFYSGGGGGGSGGGGAGDTGSAGGGGSFLDTTFDDGSASFVSGFSTPGGDGTGTLANGSIQITLVTTVDAVDDTYGPGVVNEDAGATRLSPDLLTNDLQGVVSGATLNWNPTVDMDALDDDDLVGGVEWQDATGSAAWDLDAAVTLNLTPTTTHSGITAAYVFDGSGTSGAVFDYGVGVVSQDSFQDIIPDPTGSNATTEIWFKDALTNDGNQIIFETGATTDGSSLKFDDSTNILTLALVDNTTNFVTHSFDLDTIGVDASADFVQVAWTYEVNNPGTTDTVTLYVNGAIAGTALTSTALDDWAGGDDAGLGRTDGGINVAGGNPFAGEIAIFRLYESVLSGDDVQQNYSSVANFLGDTITTTSIVTGNTLNYDATNDTGADSLWQNELTQAHDWSVPIGAGVTHDATPVSGFVGINGAFSFDGTAGMTANDLGILTGNPSDASASFEFWVKPSDLTGNEVIFESGGGGDGISIGLLGSTLQFLVDSNNTAPAVDANITHTLTTSEINDFIQIVATIDINAGVDGSMILYVNGVEVGTATGVVAGLFDWDGGDNAGLGTINGSSNEGTYGNFVGDLAIFRFYESALTLSQVQQNFYAVAGPLVTSIDSTMGGPTSITAGNPATITTDMGGLVTVGFDGSISYNPNGQFSSLNYGDTATDTFTYTTTNGTVFDTATATITIDGNNEYELSSLAAGGGTQGTIFNGIAAGDGAGYQVTSAGDVNGDGFDDILIGATTADPNGTYSGGTYVVFGQSASFSAEFELSTLNGTNGFVLNGIDTNDFSGRSISAGDVNGDGLSDLIIGAVSADPNGVSRAGETYVVFGAGSFGAAFELSTLAGGDGSTGFVLNGIAADDISGRTVAFAGDVNGDGLGDIAIAAPWADPNGSYSGETYLIYGRTDFSPILGGGGGEFELSSLAGGGGTNGTVFNGVAAADYSGSSVAGAGDIDGDGFDDLVIGAWGASPGGTTYAGSSYVVFGQSASFGGAFELSTLNGTNGFVLNGVAVNDYSGGYVSSAGDINGDGFNDVVVSATYADPNGASSGTTYIVYGKGTAFAASIDLSSADVTINGASAGDYSGSSATSAGDINGDGFDDLIIGRGVYGGIDAGASYVVFGSRSLAASIELSTVIPSGGATVTTGFVLSGITADDYSGLSVSSAGDMNGDGFDDLIIGAYYGDTNGASSGESYVIYGKDFRHESPIVGTSGADVVTGGAGDDVLNAGAGDDTITFDVNDTTSIDGGGGTDTLSFAGTGGINLDLTTISNTVYRGIEIIDLTGSGNNTLTLSTLDLFDLSGSSNILTVDGNAGDSVDLTDFGSWTFDGLSGGYNVYSNGEAIIRIQTAVSVSALVPLESELPLEEQELIAGAEPGTNDVPAEDENTSEQEKLAAVSANDGFNHEVTSLTQVNNTLAGLTPFSQQLKAVANTFNTEANVLMLALSS